MAQLQNKMYICEKMHNCETHLIAIVHFLATLNYYFSLFLILTYFHAPTPPSSGHQDEVATISRAAADHCLSRATSFFYFCYFPLPSDWKG